MAWGSWHRRRHECSMRQQAKQVQQAALTSFLPTSAEKILETSTLRTTASHPAGMDEVYRDTFDAGAAAKEQ